MFHIRLSLTNSDNDSLEDIELPEVPAVNDEIQIIGPEPVTYRVKARQFSVVYENGVQIVEAMPRVLLHVEAVSADKPFNYSGWVK